MLKWPAAGPLGSGHGFHLFMSTPAMSFACDACGRRYKWTSSVAGKRVKCSCGHGVTVPAATPPSPVNATSAPTRAASAARATRAAGGDSVAPDVYDLAPDTSGMAQVASVADVTPAGAPAAIPVARPV